MMRGVCLFVLALAVVTAEEGKPPMLGPDVKLMAQCTDSLTTLMNNKAKVIQGLNGITSKVADQSKPAKTKAESKAQPAKPAAKKSEANKPPAKPAELGEGGEVGRNWPGLKSMSRKVTTPSMRPFSLRVLAPFFPLAWHTAHSCACTQTPGY